jgi:hypothetical protein
MQRTGDAILEATKRQDSKLNLHLFLPFAFVSALLCPWHADGLDGEDEKKSDHIRRYIQVLARKLMDQKLPVTSLDSSAVQLPAALE